MNSVSPQVLAALGTVTATLITSIIGLVNLTGSKEFKVSEMRRDWIEALRKELSDYFQAMRHLGIAADEAVDAEKEAKAAQEIAGAMGLVEGGGEATKKNANETNKIAAFRRQKLEEAIITGNTAFYSLKLRLNSEKELQKKLLFDLKQVEDCYSSWEDGQAGLGEAIKVKIDDAIKSARELIASEWRRVKKGEPAYARIRSGLVPISLIVAIGFACVVLLIK